MREGFNIEKKESHGGKRPGAGRPKKTAIQVEKAAKEKFKKKVAKSASIAFDYLDKVVRSAKDEEKIWTTKFDNQGNAYEIEILKYSPELAVKAAKIIIDKFISDAKPDPYMPDPNADDTPQWMINMFPLKDS